MLDSQQKSNGIAGFADGLQALGLLPFMTPISNPQSQLLLNGGSAPEPLTNENTQMSIKDRLHPAMPWAVIRGNLSATASAA